MRRNPHAFGFQRSSIVPTRGVRSYQLQSKQDEVSYIQICRFALALQPGRGVAENQKMNGQAIQG